MLFTIPQLRNREDLVRAVTRKSSLPRFLIAPLLAPGLLVATSVVHAAAGDLDPTFGTGGKVIESQPNTNIASGGAVLQPDGKILVLASVSGQNGLPLASFTVFRYLPDGVLDASFGTNGEALVAFPEMAGADSIALQPDDKIVLAGQELSDSSGTGGFAVARLNPDGSVDSGFGSGGVVTTRFPSLNGVAPISDSASVVLVEPNGNILAGGAVGYCAGYRCPIPIHTALARYHADGSLDTSFGKGGLVSVAAARGPYALALLANGNVVAVNGPAIAAFDSQGNLLPTIVPGTIVATGRGNSADSFTVDVFSDAGHYVSAGMISESNRHDNDVHVLRYNVANSGNPATTGSVDATFASPPFDFGPEDTYSNNVPRAVAMQLDGKVVVGGTAPVGAGGGAGANFALARLNASGSLDSGFGSGGKVTTSFGGSSQSFGGSSFPNAVLVQADGNILLVGTMVEPVTNLEGLALVRYRGQ
jgi:uncharacterized delta-60 repeat protein